MNTVTFRDGDADEDDEAEVAADVDDIDESGVSECNTGVKYDGWSAFDAFGTKGDNGRG